MCGSGTTNIEASLMGINSYAIDVSPFCQLMTKTKYEALKIKKEFLKDVLNKNKAIFKFFNTGNALNKLKKIANTEKSRVYYLSFLAFLDSMGYSKRVVTA